ncbi:MAG: membrane protein insertion efficiency factor YidD [Phycisphaerales bacterium]
MGQDVRSRPSSESANDTTQRPSSSPELPGVSPTWGRGIRGITRGFSQLLIALVRLYRITLGPVLGGHCRFHPTCSQYMIDAINKYGPVRGTWRGIRRIARCHPWSQGGIDEA